MLVQLADWHQSPVTSKPDLDVCIISFDYSIGYFYLHDKLGSIAKCHRIDFPGEGNQQMANLAPVIDLYTLYTEYLDVFASSIACRTMSQTTGCQFSNFMVW